MCASPSASPNTESQNSSRSFTNDSLPNGKTARSASTTKWLMEERKASQLSQRSPNGEFPNRSGTVNEN